MVRVLTACHTLEKDHVPPKIFWAYGITESVMLLSIGLYDWYWLNRRDPRFRNSKIHEKIWEVSKRIWYQRKTIFVGLTHIWDQASDLAIIVLLYRFWQSTGECITEKNYIINFDRYFMAAMVGFIGYRVISSMLIFRITRNVFRIISQMLDLDLIWSVWVNIRVNSNEPSNPTRYIAGLEAIYESAPLCLVQCSLLAREFEAGGALLWTSFILSFFQLVSRINSDDKRLVIRKAQQIWSNGSMNGLYLLRLSYRTLEIALRLFMCVTMWITCGGMLLSIYLSIEFAVSCLFAYLSNDFEILYAMVVVPLKIKDVNLERYLFAWRVVVNLLVISMITIFANVPSANGYMIPDWVERQFVMKTNVGTFVYGFIWGLICLHALGFCFLRSGLISDRESTKDRSLAGLVTTHDIDGIVELSVFGCKFSSSDFKNAHDAEGSNYLHVIGALTAHNPHSCNAALAMISKQSKQILINDRNSTRGYGVTPLMMALRHCNAHFVNAFAAESGANGEINIDWNLEDDAKRNYLWVIADSTADNRAICKDALSMIPNEMLPFLVNDRDSMKSIKIVDIDTGITKITVNVTILMLAMIRQNTTFVRILVDRIAGDINWMARSSGKDAGEMSNRDYIWFVNHYLQTCDTELAYVVRNIIASNHRK